MASIYDFFNPSVGPVESMPEILEEQAKVEGGRLQHDVDRLRSRNRTLLGRALPQFRSASAAAGQFHSGARQRGEREVVQDFSHEAAETLTPLRRRLEDFERRRAYALLGMII